MTVGFLWDFSVFPISCQCHEVKFSVTQKLFKLLYLFLSTLWIHVGLFGVFVACWLPYKTFQIITVRKRSSAGFLSMAKIFKGIPPLVSNKLLHLWESWSTKRETLVNFCFTFHWHIYNALNLFQKKSLLLWIEFMF